MIKNTYFFRFGFILALLIIIIQFYFIQSSYSEGKKAHHETTEHIELAELMFHNQRFMDKLYFAGINNNWPAADFYHHELEENMEVLLEGNITEDGINLSEMAQVMYNPASIELKKAIVSEDQEIFVQGYSTLVNSCNNCHNASKVGFIKITVPKSPAFNNQEY